MSCFPRLFFSHSGRVSLRCVSHPNGRNLNPRGRKFARERVPRMLLALMSVIVAGVSFVPQLPGQAADGPPPHGRHRSAKAAVTGTDGTSTGTASFFGNFTTITTPTGALSVFRRHNCSLSLATGTYTISPNFAYTQTELAANYEQVLHSEAQLTTTPDVFAHGCTIQPPAGFGSEPGIFVGTTTTGVNVFAGLGLTTPRSLKASTFCQAQPPSRSVPFSFPRPAI